MVDRGKRKMNRSRILNCIYIFLALGALLGVLFLRSVDKKRIPIVHIGAMQIPVIIADSQPLREKGLSGVSNLSPYGGMFFVFETEGFFGFWMKEMKFPLDIVWIDATMRIVGIEYARFPESYPEVFLPTTPVKYVLEVPAGTFDVDNNYIGTFVQLEKN